MKKLTTTAIATLAVLIAVGVAFALWADVLKIHIEVNTGNVDVEFGDNPSVKEYVGFPASGGGWDFKEEGSDPEAKDVGQCAVTFEDIEDEESTGLGTSAGNDDLDLKITISNGYPGYKCEVTFEVVNRGTIPVKLYFFDEDGYRLTPLPATFTIGNNAVTCTLDGEDGAQVHPYESATYTLSCVVEQSASEDAQYSTQIYIQARQWNEPAISASSG
jgi:hypothetical protein